MESDSIFDEPTEAVTDFEFGERVVSVFDDMVSRSVPFYGEIHRMIGEIAADFATPGSKVFDLGCSTGRTLLTLDRVLPPDVHFVGIDDSTEMLEKCSQKLEAEGVTRPCELLHSNLNEGVMLNHASVVVLCLTLQFIRPIYRSNLVRQIFDQLDEGGCLILVEKVVGEASLLNRLFIKHYYEFKKRNRYSELEIAQKREALENVLIPYKLTENLAMLEESGFRSSDVFFKWYNFCGIVAVK